MPKSPHKNRRIASVPMSKEMKAALEHLAKQRGVDFGTIVREALEKEYGLKGDWKSEHEKEKN